MAALALFGIVAVTPSIVQAEGVKLFQTERAKDMAAARAIPALDCDGDKKAWTVWRDAVIANLLRPTIKGPDGALKYLDTELIAEKSISIYGSIQNCKTAPPEKLALVANLNIFSESARRIALKDAQGNHEHLFGFTITDLDYVNDYAVKEIEIPDLLKSQAFLKAVSNPETYKQAYDMIAKRNEGLPVSKQWVTLLYESQFLTTPDDTTYGRFFIYVPGEIEKWIQYGIVTPDMKQKVFCPKPKGTEAGQTICSMSIVAVRHRKAGEFPNTEVYIVDYWRVYEDDGSIGLPTRVAAGHGTSNCTYCHKTPVLPIYPAREFDFDPNGRLKEKTEGVGDIPKWLNSLIPSYGPPFFGGLLEQAAFGPELGPVKQRDEAVLKACSKGYDVDLRRIAANMDCAACHNENLMGEINFPQANYSDNDLSVLTLPDGTVHALIETYIDMGWMPPSTTLSKDEREALKNCLMTEFYDYQTGGGLLVDWLKNK